MPRSKKPFFLRPVVLVLPIVAYSLYHWPISTLLAAVCSISFAVGALFTVLRRIYFTIRYEAPTPEQLSEEDLDQCVLFKYLPQAKGRIAWRQLGVFPTPVHECHLTLDGRDVRLYLKREDLSSSKYGGNKVRTLEFQLACVEAGRKAEMVYATGAPGSNQVVASVVHSPTFNSKTTSIYWAPEAPDRDNALNLLTCMSFGASILPVFAHPTLLPTFWRLVFKGLPVLFPGGANPTGVLGHVGAVLELAEQIEKGEAPDPDAIYLPLGSGCTTSGLVLGVALARALKKKCLSKVRIHAVIIHQDMANGEKYFGWIRRFIKVMVRHTAGIIEDKLGGPKCAAEGERLAESILVLHPYVGKRYGYPLYGKHCEHSRMAKESFTASCKMVEGPPPWLCSTFTSKCVGVLFDELRTDPTQKDVILWQTKSLVQPMARGAEEWKVLKSSSKALCDFVSRSGISGPEHYADTVTRVDPPVIP